MLNIKVAWSFKYKKLHLPIKNPKIKQTKTQITCNQINKRVCIRLSLTLSLRISLRLFLKNKEGSGTSLYISFSA